MTNKELKKWKKEKQFMDEWDIDAEIKEQEAQLEALMPKVKIILNKLDDLTCLKSIKRRIYNESSPKTYFAKHENYMKNLK